jgi:predicted RecA/RadA family phage recombinase
MASNRVHGGDRIKVTASADHSAGDLVYEGGFYGIAQDDVSSGDIFALILDGVWNLPRVPSTLGMGLIVAAPATNQATGLQMLQWTTHPSLNTLATTAWNAIGRTIATGTATTAKVQLFAQNQVSF